MEQAETESEQELSHGLEREITSLYREEEDTVVAATAEELEIRKPPRDLCLARQPIFDIAMNVNAYELLYFPLGNGCAPAADANVSSSQVIINAFLDIGIEDISGNLPSYIPVSRDFLTRRLPLPFPPQSIVLEIPTGMDIDAEVLEGLQHFADAGFMLALDGYRFNQDKSAHLDLIDIVKVDISGCSPDALREGLHALAKFDLKLIAQKVETREELQHCKEAGFTLFQGSFVSKPLVLTGHVLKPSRLGLLKMLKMLDDPDCDISILEELISQDVTLSYKILRIINSAYYGFRRKIESVKQAVVSLGLKVIRDWFIVISLTDIDDKPEELMLLTLQRARMMYSLTNAMGLNRDTGFTIGLFSSIDAIMDQPMEQILDKLPLSEEISEALLHREGTMGQMLDIVLHYERGDWVFVKDTGFEMSEVSTFYFEAMYWARGLFDQIKSDD